MIQLFCTNERLMGPLAVLYLSHSFYFYLDLSVYKFLFLSLCFFLFLETLLFLHFHTLQPPNTSRRYILMFACVFMCQVLWVYRFTIKYPSLLVEKVQRRPLREVHSFKLGYRRYATLHKYLSSRRGS